MQKWSRGRFVLYSLLALLITINGHAGIAGAVTANSSHYQVTETQFGTGALNACSDKYCAQASIGDMAVGTSKGTNSTAQFGTIQQDDPLIEVIVDPGVSNLGVLSTDKTASKTSIIRVRTHLVGGYQLQVVGNAPVYNGHKLQTSSSPVVSRPGTEQFGINLATNTVPAIGKDPVQMPSAETSFGVVADNYKIPNRFKYTSGDVVARSDTDSGRTDYTVSMIVNVAGNTPAGHYTSDFSAVVIPAF